jgi:arylsulfatase A-like enzyme
VQLVRHIVPWLDTHGDRPFLLFVHVIDPQAPYDPPPETAGRFQRGPGGRVRPDATHREQLDRLEPLAAHELMQVLDLYDEEVLAADLALAHLLRHLRQRGLEDKTWFLVTSNHGEEFGEHGGFGHGRHLHEEVIRVPLVLRPPVDSVLAGTRVSVPVGLVDVLPTLLALIGPAGSPRGPGRDLMPFLQRSQPPPHRDIVAELGDHLRCLVQGDVKLIVRAGHGADAIRIFDLVNDPLERRDLAQGDAGVARRVLLGLDFGLNRLRRAALPLPGIGPQH